MSPPQSTAGDLGSTVTLMCNATGQPAPQYTWYRLNGREMEVIENEIGPTLTFEGLARSNRGVYSCSVSNDLDIINGSRAILSIRGKQACAQT